MALAALVAAVAPDVAAAETTRPAVALDTILVRGQRASAPFLAEDRALLFMRYIRRQLATLDEARVARNEERPE